MTRPAGHPPPLAAPALVAAARTLADLTQAQLPRLHALCGELRRETLAADARPLMQAIDEHRSAARALAFELLVPRGLRAGTSRADEAAFRLQVQRLVAATAATWGELRTYLGASAGAAARADVLLSEFVMQARAVQRRTAACDAALERSRDALDEGAAASDRHLQFAGRVQALHAQRTLLLAACAAASTVRRLMHDAEQERAAVQAALQKIAHALGGGLLERLRPMVAAPGAAGRDDVDAARSARDAVHQMLEGAAARMHRFHAARSRLVAALDAMADAVRPATCGAEGSPSMLA